MIRSTTVAWIVGILAAGCSRARVVDVGPGEFGVVLTERGTAPEPGRLLAGPGQRGIRAEVLGPGRHEVDRETRVEKYPRVAIRGGGLAEDGAALPPEVGVVTALIGDPLPEGEFLADPGQRGILRRVLTPGSYALNPYAYRVDVRPATVVPAGHVGVVTHLSGDPPGGDLAGANERGVQRDVLAPGIHFLNPAEHEVNPVRVGWRELTFAGGQAISFPSSDSDYISVEITLVWGLRPEDAPWLVKRFGDEAGLVERMIRPQVESIVRLAGSDKGSRDFLAGDERERFQEQVDADLRASLERKSVRMLLALVRSLDLPETVRKPLQAARLAEEETLTNHERVLTSQSNQELNRIKGEVAVAVAKAKADTYEAVAALRAQGDEAVAAEQARTRLRTSEGQTLVAARRREAEAVKGAAGDAAERLLGEAAAAASAARIEALGGAAAYRLLRFAESLQEDLKIEVKARPRPERD